MTPTGGSDMKPTDRRIQYGNLEREQSNLDQAMYVAGCLCGSHGPQAIYCSTVKGVADPETGERYLIIDESDTSRRHLKPDEQWQPVYRIERAAAQAESTDWLDGVSGVCEHGIDYHLSCPQCDPDEDDLRVSPDWLMDARSQVNKALRQLDLVYTDRDEHWAAAVAALREADRKLADALDPKSQIPF